MDKLTKDATETTMLVKGYEGNDELKAGLIYEMLLNKKVSGEHMDLGTPSHKSEIMIREVTKKQKEDFVKNETIYKIEFTAVVI